MSLRFGIEFEFIGPGRWYLGRVLQRHAVPVGTSYEKWTISCDGSVLNDRETCEKFAGPSGYSGNECVEMRTPMMDPDNPDHIAEIQRVLEIISYLDCHPTKSSGMHIHISSTNEADRVDVTAMSPKLEKAFRKFVYKNRSGYCEQPISWGKNGAIRVVAPQNIQRDANNNQIPPTNGNHIEIRIFNSTLDFAKVNRRLKKVIEFYREHLYPNGEGLPVSTQQVAAVEQAPAATPETSMVEPNGAVRGCTCAECNNRRLRTTGSETVVAAPAAAPAAVADDPRSW